MANPSDQQPPMPDDDHDASNPFESPAASELPSVTEFSGVRYVTKRAKPVNVLTSIWIRPRVTVRRVLDRDPGRHVLMITVLSGISNALGNSVQSLGKVPDVGTLLAASLYVAAIGAVVSILLLYVGSWLFTGVGRMFGGVGHTNELRTAIAYANIISMWCLPLTLCAVVVFWHALRDPQNQTLYNVLVAIGVVLIICGVWQFVVLCGTVAEAHQFSVVSAFLTTLLIYSVVFGLVFLIFWSTGIV